MQSSDIRARFLEFFKKRNHTILSSASLVTTDEQGVTNTTLFNTAGMQPLVPYLLGKPHPEGNRLANVQKCVRTIDIDDIGDKTHATFFEMLGNWSLGDYFKKEAITWSYEFLTSKEEGLGLDPHRLYVTVFEGDANSPRDLEAAEAWKSLGVPEHRIYFKGAEANWWPAVKGKDTWTGPTGPCSEMFYDITESGLGDLTPEQFEQADSEQKIVEIWNDVFMEFEKKEGTIVGKLTQKNVDTGAGLERLAAVLQKKDNIYDTDLLKPVMDLMVKAPNSLSSKRIIADHLRASTFLIADGVIPSNTDRGYILRRLIRRAIINTTDKKLDEKRISMFIDTLVGIYEKSYPELLSKKEYIKGVLNEEAGKFGQVLVQGIKEFEKSAENLTPEVVFNLYTTHGLPFEIIKEMAKEKGLTIDEVAFEKALAQHQSLSRAGAEQKFKGGLSDVNDPMVLRYHTATHLLHQALHDVLGEGVGQKGSNITPERLRFDFSYGTKMTDEQKKKVEDIINEKITQHIPMKQVTMPRAQAEQTGARHFFGEKYGEEISIYFIGDTLDAAYSKEFCGGPHVSNTSELAGPEGKWRFKIQKEEAISQGVRRIKAVLG
ncbi:MAG: alanine--tRNA ligase [Parcubacteria bacterium C7867-002]|nr:MAG: alanine--tRNA ligase [Parcubacteria bacterium C7867-002]